MLDFLDWLARAGGFLALLVALLGFVFREKWKQILAKSMAADIERLKADLAREHAEHSANLAPRLEAAKYDFQEKLEAYKVSLIAETERIKAQNELRKSFAMRLTEVEFERLIELESSLASIYSLVLGRAKALTKDKNVQHMVDVNKRLGELDLAMDKAEMFMPLEDRREMLDFYAKLLDLSVYHIGPDKPPFDTASQGGQEILRLASVTHTKVKDRIRFLGGRE